MKLKSQRRGAVMIYWFFFLIYFTGVLNGRANVYVSRVSGDDKWSCSLSKPCKTISRAINLAERGDHIYLNGANTDKDPYTCESEMSPFPGIYIKKSLSFIGMGPAPQIRCLNGTSFISERSDNDLEVMVVFLGLVFNDTALTFRDSSAEIDGCTLAGSKQRVEFTVANTTSLSIRIRNSLFWKNAHGLSVGFGNTAKYVVNRNRIYLLVLEVQNTTFRDHFVAFETEETRLINIGDNGLNQSFKCKLTLDNVTFTNNMVSRMGLVYVNVKNGRQDLVLKDTFVYGNNHLCSAGDCTELIVDGENVSTLISGAYFVGLSGRALRISASNLTVQVYNSSLAGYEVHGDGGAFLFSATDLANITILNSSFVKTGTFGASRGGAIHLECLRSAVILHGCVFKHIKAWSGGAVSIRQVFKSWSSNKKNNTQEKRCSLYKRRTKSLLSIDITDCLFKYVSSYSANGGAVLIAGPTISVQLLKTYFVRSSSLGRGGAVAFFNPYSAIDLGKDRLTGFENFISIEDSFFLNSASVGHGGAIFIDDSIAEYNLTIKDTNFTNISAKAPGGAISILSVSSKSSQGGSKNNIAIENSRFVNNTASAPGGAIYITHRTENHNVTIKNSYFTKNNATGGPGGAIHLVNLGIEKSQLHFENFVIIETSNFVENTANGPGGAVYISGGSVSQNVTIKSSSFSSNNASDRGGAVALDNNSLGNCLTINDSRFTENVAFAAPGGGVFLDLNFRKLIMSNVTFRNCKSAESVGGGLYLHMGNKSRIVVQNSLFLNNSSPTTTGGGLLVTMASDTLEDPGCIKIGKPETFPKWGYNSDLLFKDTTFKYNTALIGGAVNLQNGRTTFQNCSFVDNFASAVGGTIYAGDGSTSVILRNSGFLQSKAEWTDHLSAFSKSSFIHTESVGPLVVQNTTLNATRNAIGNSLVTIGKGGPVDFGANNLTKLYCPVGSAMQFLNFSNKITTTTKDFSCTVKVTGLDYRCLPCPGGLYSLQRGQAYGTYLKPGFQCLICPFGANCSKNIVAKPNFWGFEVSKYPPTLQFTICPMGYCCSNEQLNSFDYNDCQGNRSGVLCGKCKPGFTETLYSTHCRPISECTDYWFWPVAVLYVLILALYFTFKPPIPSWIKRQILWFKAAKTATTQEPDFDRGYLKIGFYFYQAGNLLLVSSSYPKSLFKTYFVEPVVGLFNFQQKIGSSSGLVCPFPGFTVVTKYFFSTFHVFGTLFMICLLYCLHVGFQKIRCSDTPSAGPYLGGMLQILLLGYTSIGTVSFDLLRCVPINNERRLFYDGNVVCLQWWQYLSIAFIVLFVVPFWLVLFWGSLKLHREALSVKRFMLACFFPLPFLIHWLFSALLGNSTDENHPHSLLLTEFVEKVLYDPFKRPVDDKGGALGWESVLIGRRLILIIVKAVVSDPFSRVTLMTFFSFLVLLHHLAKQPFRDSKANIVETISLFLLIVLGMLNLFPAAFLSLAVSSTGPFADWLDVCSWMELVILGFVPAGCVLFVISFVVSQFCRLMLLVCRFLGFSFELCKRICCYSFWSEDTRLFIAPVT